MRTNRRTFPAAEIIPATSLAPIEFATVFGRSAPLEVDLGCGDGSFLVALARQSPEKNFVGVERLPGRVRSACRKIGALRLTNARILRHDLLDAVRQLFAPASVDSFNLMFSDPWPKRRHQSRRVVTPEFLRATSRALQVGGVFRIATDDADYFAAMEEMVATFPAFARIVGNDERQLPITTFEERFRDREIHRLALRNVSLRRNGAASQ
jgi:tRNA (guanine-N7-)-methyltransferase